MTDNQPESASDSTTGLWFAFALLAATSLVGGYTNSAQNQQIEQLQREVATLRAAVEKGK